MRINGLRVARAFATPTRTRACLLCAVELCSLHYHYGWDPQKMVANAIFADGAAAVVGAPDSLRAGRRLARVGDRLVSDSRFRDRR